MKEIRKASVSDQTYRQLMELENETGQSKSSILERAVKRSWTEQWLLKANVAWSSILDDENARAEFDAEDKLWDQTLADGLADDSW